MAAQKTKARSGSSRSKSSSRSAGSRSTKSVKGAAQEGESKGRRASEKSEKYRFAQNVGGAGTVAEREYEGYALSDIEDPRGDPDVLLDVPVIKVDSIHLEVDDLDAHVALKANVLELVKLNAGVDVHLGKLRIDIKGVEAQALLKVRLDHVAAIVDRVLTTIDRNPELVKSIGRTVQQVGEGAGQAVGEVGQGAGQAVGDVGEGAGDAVGNLEQTLAGLGETAGQAGQAAGQAVGGVGQAAGGVGQAAGGLLGGGKGGGGGAGNLAGISAGDIAKLATKLVAQELKASVEQEAKELGLVAARKAKEVGQRRKERKAEDLNATEAALRTAEELDVNIEDAEGSGPEGRITIRDVRQLAEA